MDSQATGIFCRIDCEKRGRKDGLRISLWEVKDGPGKTSSERSFEIWLSTLKISPIFNIAWRVFFPFSSPVRDAGIP